MTREELVKKIMAMQYNNKDTFTMLKAADKVPDAMLPRIVGVSPQGVYTSTNYIEYGTAPSNEIITTTTGTSTTNTDFPFHVTMGGTADNPIAVPVPAAPSPMPMGWYGNATGDTWEPPPAPKRKRKKKAVRTPIQISPRNPGMRRILLED